MGIGAVEETVCGECMRVGGEERRFWKTPVVVDIINIDGNVRVSLPRVSFPYQTVSSQPQAFRLGSWQGTSLIVP